GVEPHDAIAIADADADTRVRIHGHARLDVDAVAPERAVADSILQGAAVLDRERGQRETEQPVRLNAPARQHVDALVEVGRVKGGVTTDSQERAGVIRPVVANLERSWAQTKADDPTDRGPGLEARKDDDLLSADLLVVRRAVERDAVECKVRNA